MDEHRVPEGYLKWVIPDCWMPPKGSAEVRGHEAVCITNTGLDLCKVRFTVFYETATEESGSIIECAARSSLHILLDDETSNGGLKIPRETPYSLEVMSSKPVVVQYTRVDTRLGGLALMTSLGWPCVDEVDLN